MKKNLVALLLVLVVVSFGLFAVDPGPTSFDVKTSVSAINQMKLTKAAFSGTDLSSATAFAGNVNDGDGSGWSVTAGGEQSALAAHISTLSNNRAGYTVTMSATPMKSTINSVDAYINYIVSTDADGTEAGSFNTSEDVAPVEVIKVTSLTQLTGTSRKISIIVDSGEFTAAVEGNYTGKITFTYEAN